MDCYEMAKKMLRVDFLPPELGERLRAIEDMIHSIKPSGDFTSSQVVACVVEQWSREHPGG